LRYQWVVDGVKELKRETTGPTAGLGFKRTRKEKKDSDGKKEKPKSIVYDQGTMNLKNE